MSVNLISKNLIEKKILTIRNEKVILDRDLAVMYGVSTSALNQAVKRNIERFPSDFMFQLDKSELNELITNCDKLGSLKFSPSKPYVFTEHGILMLSSVLNSKKAVQVNIAIMRVFILMRKLSFSYEALEKRLSFLEKKQWKNDNQVKEILDTISFLVRGNKENSRREIKGFIA